MSNRRNRSALLHTKTIYFSSKLNVWIFVALQVFNFFAAIIKNGYWLIERKMHDIGNYLSSVKIKQDQLLFLFYSTISKCCFCPCVHFLLFYASSNQEHTSCICYVLNMSHKFISHFKICMQSIYFNLHCLLHIARL